MQRDFDSVGDFQFDLLRARTGVARRDHRRLDCEFGILQLTQGKEAGYASGQQKEYGKIGDSPFLDRDGCEVHALALAAVLLDKADLLAFAQAVDARRHHPLADAEPL